MAYTRTRMGRLAAGDLEVGVPIPYSVYDEHRNLLLTAGVTLTNERQLEALVERGLYRVERILDSVDPGAAPEDPLARFDQLCRELNSLLMASDGAEFAPRLTSIAARLGSLCQVHPEACLASILHDRATRYPIRHMVHVAVVAHLLAIALEIPESDRISLVAAALTMNISILDLQAELNAQGDRPLLPPDRLRIRRHPETTAALLETWGVADPAWIGTVRQHHEAFDGSGYPAGISGDAVSLGARVLALADAYTARLRHRTDREPKLANESLREVFLSHESLEPRLVVLLVRTVGIFPPGLVVGLENGEVAVVTRLTGVAHAPEVYAVTSPSQVLLSPPVRRLTDVAPYRIHNVIPLEDVRHRFDPLRFWRP